MKTVKIGDLNFSKYKTEIRATEDVVKLLKSAKVSTSNLIPAAWFWYDAELFPELDEDGDGKPDNKFGKDFQMIYFKDTAITKELEQKAFLISNTTVKNIKLKYAAIPTKDAKD